MLPGKGGKVLITEVWIFGQEFLLLAKSATEGNGTDSCGLGDAYIDRVVAHHVGFRVFYTNARQNLQKTQWRRLPGWCGIAAKNDFKAVP